MFQHHRSVLLLLGLWGGLVSIHDPTQAQGIPEPNLILYGQVRNITEGSVRLNLGEMTWRWRSQFDGTMIEISTTLTNLNDQFSYVLRMPCESPVSGFASSPNTFQLTPIQLGYTLDSVEVNGHVAQSALSQLNLSTDDKGATLRVDVSVAYDFADADNDGLPDFWECAYFNCNGHPFFDDDGDGMSNLEEYQAGTDPTDPQSLFAFIDVVPSEDGFMLLRWSSVADKRYSILRSTDPLTSYGVLEAGIVATPPTNEYRDTASADGAPRFYRLLLEP